MYTVTKLASGIPAHVQSIDVKGYKHGLIIVTKPNKQNTTTWYAINVTVRNTDMQSILRALIKLCLAEELTRLNANLMVEADYNANLSEKRASGSELRSALNGFRVAVTDKHGCVIKTSWIYPLSGKSLRSELMPAKPTLHRKAELYDRVVICQYPWEDARVGVLLNHEVRANILLWDYCERLDAAVMEVNRNQRVEYVAQINTQRSLNAAEREKAQRASAEAV